MFISRYPPHIGGAELQCQRLSKCLSERGHEVTVVTETPRSDLPREAKEQAVRVVRLHNNLPLPWGSLVSFFNFFGYAIRHPEADIFHAHLLSANAVAAVLAGRCLRKPVLVKIAGARHTGDLSTSARTSIGRFKLALMRWAQVSFVCPTDETAAEAASINGRPERIYQIPNGVDETTYKPLGVEEKKRLRESLSLSHKPLWAVYAGRWAPGKGVESLIELWERGVQESRWDWGLLLVFPDRKQAPTPYWDRLERLGPHIQVLYNPSSLLSYYQAGDLAVLFSQGEGLSNFLLESMACGLPTLTTEAASIDPNQSNGWGWIVRNPSPDEGLTKFLEIQRDPDLLKPKALAARKKIEERYGLSTIADRYEALYKELTHVRDLRHR